MFRAIISFMLLPIFCVEANHDLAKVMAGYEGHWHGHVEYNDRQGEVKTQATVELVAILAQNDTALVKQYAFSEAGHQTRATALFALDVTGRKAIESYFTASQRYLFSYDVVESDYQNKFNWRYTLTEYGINNNMPATITRKVQRKGNILNSKTFVRYDHSPYQQLLRDSMMLATNN
ncbi:hypothetical protein OE749_11225 [Aestuariibacter sp. AA17]|uniref:Uncharacterized protein n=1 Tax=Fluctibacter corallii TaxID=2984329 RepID=A0ABT3A9B4_9ALTE|nr:hypothetical protein [Aestuariibacter sp. AA17]MCV2885263.1 hypothetical protein [Aestuariibacter sp. AA17]